VTATITPPTAPAESAGATHTDSHGSRWRAAQPLATLSLAAVSAATAIGMIRLFADWSYLRPMLAAVAAVHLCCYLLRVARISGWIAIPLSFAAVLSAVGMAFHRGDLLLGLPTPALINSLRQDLRLVFDQFPTAVAPVPSVGVFVASAALLLACCAAVSDTFAFRAFGRLEAVVPAGLVFVFTSALAAERSRVLVSVVWVVAALVCVACLRSAHDADDIAWLGRRRRRNTSATLTAAAMALLVGVLASVAAVRLPGAGEDPLIETRNRIDDVTQVVSPLVDIRSRIVNRTNTTMIIVEASEPSYWRASGLDDFDGTVWRPGDEDLTSASGPFNAVPAGAPINYQRITVQALAGSLLPAAPEPVQATSPLLWAERSGAVVVPDEGMRRGDVYEVASAMLRPTADQLRAASSSDAPSGSTALPDGLPDAVLELAIEATAGAATNYDRAVALQNWFRDNFTYDLKVQLGHSGDAMREFLRIRRGYCEQFAGTFATMARSLGIPARVAVGFTSGTRRPDGRYQVVGRNAHSWGEIWFDGIGWVLFEPTPGRGAPGAENYTGAPESQGSDVGDDGATQPGAQPNADIEPTQTTAATAGGTGTTVSPVDSNTAGRSPSVPMLPIALVALVALGWAWFALAPRLAARRHRPPSDEPPARVTHAWHRAVEALVRSGAPSPGGSTPTEYARVLEYSYSIDGRATRELAKAVTTATFSPTGVDDGVATRSEVLSTELRHVAAARRTAWGRFTDRVLLR
jgi:transglutaminase-like putative cysteine protease